MEKTNVREKPVKPLTPPPLKPFFKGPNPLLTPPTGPRIRPVDGETLCTERAHAPLRLPYQCLEQPLVQLLHRRKRPCPGRRRGGGTAAGPYLTL